jgi:hypothetical protein
MTLSAGRNSAHTKSCRSSASADIGARREQSHILIAAGVEQSPHPNIAGIETVVRNPSVKAVAEIATGIAPARSDDGSPHLERCCVNRRVLTCPEVQAVSPG